MGIDAAAVDVADEDEASVEVAERAEVHDVAHHEVEFNGAAGAFEDEDVGIAPFAPSVECVGDDAPEAVVVAVVFLGFEMTLGDALENELRAVFGGRLDEDGVHLDRGEEAAGFGLDGLGAGHLASVEGGPGVVGHVLRLEGGDAHALAAEPGAEGDGDPAFPYAGGGAEDAEGFHGIGR